MLKISSLRQYHALKFNSLELKKIYRKLTSSDSWFKEDDIFFVIFCTIDVNGPIDILSYGSEERRIKEISTSNYHRYCMSLSSKYLIQVNYGWSRIFYQYDLLGAFQMDQIAEIKNSIFWSYLWIFILHRPSFSLGLYDRHGHY